MMRVRQRDDDTSWMKAAHCRGLTSMFFPETESDKTTVEARMICASCPVRKPCHAYAMRWNESWGVWGGEITATRKGRRRRGRPAKAAS